MRRVHGQLSIEEMEAKRAFKEQSRTHCSLGAFPGRIQPESFQVHSLVHCQLTLTNQTNKTYTEIYSPRLTRILFLFTAKLNQSTRPNSSPAARPVARPSSPERPAPTDPHTSSSIASVAASERRTAIAAAPSILILPTIKFKLSAFRSTDREQCGKHCEQQYR